MTYYANINSYNKIETFDVARMTKDSYGSSDVQNIEVSEEIYNNAKQYGKNYYTYSNGEIILNPAYDTEEAAKREADFKSKFFEISSYGWYRKEPKGYSSAVESLNTAFNAVSLLGKLPANTMIFYAEPDFTKPEECTEEWLVEHQTKNAEMTVEEFGTFYMNFMTAWNAEMHE